MTQNEFWQWLAYHATAFPNLSDWFASLPDDGVPTKRLWYRAMMHITQDQADQVTDSWHGGRAERPMKWEDVPGAIVSAVTNQYLSTFTRSDPDAHIVPTKNVRDKTRRVLQRCMANMRTIGVERDAGISMSGLDGLSDHLVAEACRELQLK